MGIGADGGATHRTVAMRKTLPLLTVSLLLIGLVGSAFATYIIDKPTFFASSNGSYITFSPSLLPLTFSTLYRGSDGYWNFNSTKIRTTVSMTITVFCGGNWTNYTVSGAGTQNIYNGIKPTQVWINGVNMMENTGWTYSAGIVTVGLATSTVSIGFATTLPVAPITDEINFYFLDEQTLAFYSHVYTGTFTIHVDSGTWYGKNGTISYNDTDPSGSLTFIANESCILQLDLVNGWVSVNGSTYEQSRTANITSGDTVSIAWFFNISANLWIPIRPAMGVAGFAIMLIMPLLIIRKAREHEWKWVLMPGFVSLVLGYCLIVGWLWP